MSAEPTLPGIDVDTPNATRMYDYHLGGSHNFAADRMAAERTREAMPWVAAAIRANRSFLGRAVRFCVQEGVTQFLDLGSGIPTVGNVHEIARRYEVGARVAYVDNEGVAAATSAAVLADDPLSTITQADLRDPDAVLAAPGVAGLLDFSRPVALLTMAVLHFMPDADDPAAIVARYRSRLAPGSLHVLSHATADHDPAIAQAAAATYRTTSNPIQPRTYAQVAACWRGRGSWNPGWWTRRCGGPTTRPSPNTPATGRRWPGSPDCHWDGWLRDVRPQHLAARQVSSQRIGGLRGHHGGCDVGDRVSSAARIRT